ncbi:MAG: hypothetical protein PWQ59_1125 [Thermoanaerobacterium sp.]|jgi:recombinational DNA repair protein (RecF pathway)|nr:hypothetical protein [Thermoanaerobacterium sp.]MDN5301456.1 hypothetical protein [Thermoanaerobacteraceae bacterium]
MNKINDKIIKEIDKNSTAENITQFLKELLLQEANHPGIWHYKNTYRRAIEKYSGEEGERNED